MLHAHRVQVRLVRQSPLLQVLHAPEFQLQVALQHRVEPFLLLRQEDAEVKLVHPFAQGIELRAHLLLLRRRLCRSRVALRPDVSTLVERLFHRRRQRILVLAHVRRFEPRESQVVQVEGQLRHVALHLCFGFGAELRQPSLARIVERELQGLFNQSVLPRQRKVALRRLVAGLERSLRPEGQAAHGGAERAGHAVFQKV